LLTLGPLLLLDQIEHKLDAAQQTENQGDSQRFP
jgi:hypothetical protein